MKASERAMTDLEKCEVDPKLTIDMGLWHKYNQATEVCNVCFAGSVIVPKTLLPDDMDDEWQKRLEALEEFRKGNVGDGLHYMQAHLVPDRSVASYKEDADEFKTDMGRLADDLEKAGL